MNTESGRKRAEVADEISKWTVGGGIVTMVLFPLALPILALTAVALLPLLVPVLAVGILAGVVYLPVTLARRIRRRQPQLGGGRAAEEETLAGVELTPAHH
jgi:hypothetical protein